jgi:hypothetical protein
MERSLEHFVSCIDFGALSQQILDHLGMALLYSEVDSRLAVHFVHLAKDILLMALPFAK